MVDDLCGIGFVGYYVWCIDGYVLVVFVRLYGCYYVFVYGLYVVGIGVDWFVFVGWCCCLVVVEVVVLLDY